MEETESDRVDARGDGDTDIGIDPEIQVNVSGGTAFKSKVSTCKAQGWRDGHRERTAD